MTYPLPMLKLMYDDLAKQVEEYRNLRDLHATLQGRMRASKVAIRALKDELKRPGQARR